MLEEEKRRINHESLASKLKSHIENIQQKEKQLIADKVKESIKNQLEDAAKEIILLESERDRYLKKSIEQSLLIGELDGLVRMYNREEEESKKEIDLQKKINEEYKKLSRELQKETEMKDGEILEKDDSIKKLKFEVEELKGVIFKLNDVRIVLNRLMDPYSRE